MTDNICPKCKTPSDEVKKAIEGLRTKLNTTLAVVHQQAQHIIRHHGEAKVQQMLHTSHIGSDLVDDLSAHITSGTISQVASDSDLI